MAERTGFEPVEERLAPHRFSKPAHSTTLPSLQIRFIIIQSGGDGKYQKLITLRFYEVIEDFLELTHLRHRQPILTILRLVEHLYSPLFHEDT